MIILYRTIEEMAIIPSTMDRNLNNAKESFNANIKPSYALFSELTGVDGRIVTIELQDG